MENDNQTSEAALDERKENCSQQRRASRNRHNLALLKARVMIRGLTVIDKRTLAARELIAWKESLISDLGGQDAISAQQLAIVEVCTRTKLILDHCDSYILSQETVINRRKRALFPIVADRTRLADSLTRMLAQLGLQRIPKPVKALSEYLAEKTIDAPTSPAPIDEPGQNF